MGGDWRESVLSIRPSGKLALNRDKKDVSFHITTFDIRALVGGRVAKNENFPDSKIFVAKTFRIKGINRVNFQICDKCA